MRRRAGDEPVDPIFEDHATERVAGGRTREIGDRLRRLERRHQLHFLRLLVQRASGRREHGFVEAGLALQLLEDVERAARFRRRAHHRLQHHVEPRLFGRERQYALRRFILQARDASNFGSLIFEQIDKRLDLGGVHRPPTNGVIDELLRARLAHRLRQFSGLRPRRRRAAVADEVVVRRRARFDARPDVVRDVDVGALEVSSLVQIRAFAVAYEADGPGGEGDIPKRAARFGSSGGGLSGGWSADFCRSCISACALRAACAAHVAAAGLSPGLAATADHFW